MARRWRSAITVGGFPQEVFSRVTSRQPTFTIKGWLFTKPPAQGVGTVFDISTNFVSVSDIDDLTGGSLDDYKTTNNNPADDS